MTAAVGRTVAETLVAALQARGVRRVFGVPGGGSSLDIIDAAGAAGVEFVLTATEAAATLMAAVTGELTATPGVALTAIGPGAASAVNGVAYAWLERAPLVLITDSVQADDEETRHQRFDQAALFAPLTKRSGTLTAANAGDIDAWLALAVGAPPGPVHIDLSAVAAAAPAPAYRPTASATAAETLGGDGWSAAERLVAAARRPVIVPGMQARTIEASRALRELVERLDCPVLPTYKAKGVLPDTDLRVVGLCTGAAAEADCLDRADLIILYGLDPVELIPGDWRYPAPLRALSEWGALPCPRRPAAALLGPLAASARRLAASAPVSAWLRPEIDALRDGIEQRLAMPAAAAGRSAQAVVEAVQAAAPRDCRLTVDAGAHMFSVMAAWRAAAPLDVLKSNGLSTMGYALPAAIAAALEEPARRVVACTGDGGLMMCLAELATAARLSCPVTVIVFNDAALSLIDVKQQRQGRAPLGVRYPRVDIAAAAVGLGCRAWRVEQGGELARVLDAAFAVRGPSLVDVTIDPAPYRHQLEALRG